MGKKVDLNKRHITSLGRKNFRHNSSGIHNSTNRNIDESQDTTPENIENQSNQTNRTSIPKFTKAKGEIKIPISPKLKIILILVAAVLAILFVAITVVIILDDDGSSGIGAGGYYTPRCSEMTVIFTDKENNYEPTGTETYSLEDYVAGVVYAEVGSFGDPEIYKLFSIAARTYGLNNADETCTIESSDRKQVFKDITDDSSNNVQMIYDAVKETDNKVFLSGSDLYPVYYDAFCSIEVDDNYYTIKQQNQKIPVEWVENQKGIISDWKEGTCKGNHGNGISQYGAYYLSDEKEYTYEELAEYYFQDDEVSISTMSMMTSIAGLDIKNTTQASYTLNTLLTTYLESKGSSLDEYNSFIKNNVIEAGVGTREGVVTAAVSLINFLYDNFDAKLPYYWGGSAQMVGLPSTLGSYITSMVSAGGNVYYYTSFDCSGFVSWAIRNGGYNIARYTTYGFDNLFAGDSCNVTDVNCIGQPGDLINSKSSHVQMIVAVDQEAGKYMVAESTSAGGVFMREVGMHSPHYGQHTKILRMDNFYNNEKNVDENY